MNSCRTTPDSGCPSRLASGRSATSIPPPGTRSPCHPDHTTVWPCRIKKPLPASATLSGSVERGASLSDPRAVLLPRLFTSYRTRWLPRARIDRLQDVDVAGELDESTTVARSVVQVDDIGVAGVGGVEREADSPGQPFVRASIAERTALCEHCAPIELEADLRLHRYVLCSEAIRVSLPYSHPEHSHPEQEGRRRPPPREGLGSAAVTTARCSVVPSPLPYPQRLSSAPDPPAASGPDSEEEWLTMALNGAPWMRFRRSPS